MRAKGYCYCELCPSFRLHARSITSSAWRWAFTCTCVEVIDDMDQVHSQPVQQVPAACQVTGVLHALVLCQAQALDVFSDAHIAKALTPAAPRGQLLAARLAPMQPMVHQCEATLAQRLAGRVYFGSC